MNYQKFLLAIILAFLLNDVSAQALKALSRSKNGFQT